MVISVLSGVISILANLEDMASIGPNAALALLSLFYCGIINLVIILPFTLFIKSGARHPGAVSGTSR